MPILSKVEKNKRIFMAMFEKDRKNFIEWYRKCYKNGKLDLNEATKILQRMDRLIQKYRF